MDNDTTLIELLDWTIPMATRCRCGATPVLASLLDDRKTEVLGKLALFATGATPRDWGPRCRDRRKDAVKTYGDWRWETSEVEKYLLTVAPAVCAAPEAADNFFFSDAVHATGTVEVSQDYGGGSIIHACTHAACISA